MFFLVIPLPNTSSFQSRNKDGKKTVKRRQKDGNKTKKKAEKKQCPFGDACAPACPKKEMPNYSLYSLYSLYPLYPL